MIGPGHYNEEAVDVLSGRVCLAILDENSGSKSTRRWAIEDRFSPPTLATHAVRIIKIRHEVAA